MTKPPDLNDEHRAGQLPDHPEDYPQVPMRHDDDGAGLDDGAPWPGDDDAPRELGEPAPEDPAVARAARLERIRSMGWTSPAPGWLDEEPPARLYLLHDRDVSPSALGGHGPGMLPRGKVGILAAAGGVGKTFALCGLALSVVTRRPWLGHFPVGYGGSRRAVLVLGEEDPLELRRRLHEQARVMGLNAGEHGESVSRILALPGAGLDCLALTHTEDAGGVRTDVAEGLLDFLRAEAERLGGGWDVVILDPLSRFAGPDVEEDNAAATRLVQVLEAFAQLPGDPAVIVAHHTNKASRREGDASANAIRGSSAIVDGARWAGSLDPIKTPKSDKQLPGYVAFRVTKSNYAAFPRSFNEADGLLLTRVGGGLRVASAEERSALDEARREEAAAKADAAAEQRSDVNVSTRAKTKAKAEAAKAKGIL